MARSMMGFGLHPLPLFLKGMSLGEPVKWQTYLVEQHPETAPIPGRQLRIMVTDEDAARTNKPGRLGKHRRHRIAVMQGRIQRDDVGELGGQRKIVRVCLERRVADFFSLAELSLARIHADQGFRFAPKGRKKVSRAAANIYDDSSVPASGRAPPSIFEGIVAMACMEVDGCPFVIVEVCRVGARIGIM